jgi:hypothetical protein
MAARGKDFSDNDLKDALLSLRSLQADYVAVVTTGAAPRDTGLHDAEARQAFADSIQRLLFGFTDPQHRLDVHASLRLTAPPSSRPG